MKNLLKNFCLFEIKGLNQEKNLNKLLKHFNIFEYQRLRKDKANFKTSYFSGEKIKKELIGMGYEVLKFEKKGILNLFFNGIISYGLLCGLFIGLFLCFFQANFVRNVEVWGNEKIDQKEIITLVKEKIGSGFKANINTKQIENGVYSAFSNLSFVSVAIVGQTLVVNVKEEIIPEEMKGVFEPLISQVDGKITSIELVQGTLAVEKGKIIQIGDVLVYPYVINSSGEKLPVKPVAKIVADVWIDGEEIHNSVLEYACRTGRKITENEVYLGKLLIYKKSAEIIFQSYETEDETSLLSKNSILPLVLKTKTYYETEKNVIEESFQDVKEDVILKARGKALQKLDNCDIIKEENYTIRQAGNLTMVNYVFTVSKSIGG